MKNKNEKLKNYKKIKELKTIEKLAHASVLFSKFVSSNKRPFHLAPRL